MNRTERPSVMYSVLLGVGFFILFRIGSYISLLTMHNASVSDYYLPTGLAVVLVFWTSPRLVLPAMYLNAVSTSYLWGIPAEDWPLWFLFGIPETIFPLLSWALFRYFKGKYWLPDINNLVLFMGVSIFIPTFVEVILLQSMLVLTKTHAANTFWQFAGSNLLSEFTTYFLITIPALYFITPVLYKRGWINPAHFQKNDNAPVSRAQVVEMTIVYMLMLVMAFFLQFSRFWFLYGLLSLYVAIRFGFGAAILTNFYIISIAYMMPYVTKASEQVTILSISDSIEVFLGANFLFAFAVVTGRVISDVRAVERKLVLQNAILEKSNSDLAETNAKLEIANRELDRFAYSVSHDLSAPLKSIQGIVNISRLQSDHGSQRIYFEKIGASAQKLLTFISEVLDYARNKRQDIADDAIDLEALCKEIIGSIQQLYVENLPNFMFNLEARRIRQDRARLKIILNNLISNAVRFQRVRCDEGSFVKVSSRVEDNAVVIEVEDNGEGIRPEIQTRVFDMFFRGNERSQGSGLGLYISKDVATQIGGTISFQSRYGMGSTFVLRMPICQQPFLISHPQARY